MVELHDERDLVGIASGDDAEPTEGRWRRRCTRPRGELGEIQRVEVGRVLGEAGRCRMLDALVDRQDRQVAGAAEPAVVEHLLQVAQHGDRPVALHKDAVDVVGPGEVELAALDCLALVAEQEVGLVPEHLADVDPHDVRLLLGRHGRPDRFAWAGGTEAKASGRNRAGLVRALTSSPGA